MKTQHLLFYIFSLLLLTSCVVYIEKDKDVSSQNNELTKYHEPKEKQNISLKRDNSCEIIKPNIKTIPKLKHLTNEEINNDEILKKTLVEYIKTLKDYNNETINSFNKSFEDYQKCQSNEN